MKKLFTALLIGASMLGPMKNSEAAIGLIGSAPMVITGLVMTAGGTGSVMVGVTLRGSTGAFEVMGAVFSVLGLIILDGDEGQKIEFAALSDEQGSMLGITNIERLTYNSEVDLANTILDQISSDVETSENPSEELSKELWGRYSQYVSPETFKVMQTIVSN